MTKFRVSGRNDLDRGEPEDGRSDATMDLVMKSATAATYIAMETARATTFELMERTENGKQNNRSQAPAPPRDRRSRMERKI